MDQVILYIFNAPLPDLIIRLRACTYIYFLAGTLSQEVSNKKLILKTRLSLIYTF